ncbi:hypothetical protein H2248_012101 [Termitomyces sp. 'cryptogamus']|nr:hypothetical protein H2248_012101 [Termitomyces sp. 'cryptogamus']
MDETTRQSQEQKDGITIRQYHHPNDLVHIQRSFVDATMTGRGSPYQSGMTMYGAFRVIYIAVSLVAFLQILPSFLAMRGDTLVMMRWTQAGIGVLCSLGSLYMWYQRRQVQLLFRIFLDEGMEGEELKDIIKTYNLHITESGTCLSTGPSNFWVAEIGGEFAGCIGLNKNLRTDATVGDVRRLFVTPAHQGKGVAKKLMTTLTLHARYHKLHALEITTSDYNQAALRFYKRIGWKVTGRTNYHGFMILVLRQELKVDID